VTFTAAVDRRTDSDGVPGVPPPSGRGTRRRVLLGVKLLATLGACAWIVSFVDWAELWRTVRGAHLGIILLVVGMRFGGMTLSAYKWQQLLTIHGVPYRLGRLVRWYLVGTFLNHFLPTSIGGDAYRIYKTLDNQRSRSSAVFAVLMERATGLVALLLLGVVSALVIYRRTGEPVALAVLGICTAGLATAGTIAWVSPRVATLGRFAMRYSWAAWVASLPELTGDFRRHPRRSVVVGILSFLFHANKLLATWLTLYALGTAMDPLVLTLAVVGMEVIGLLPISIGGLGVADGSFIHLVGRFGVAAEPALAAMLLARVLMLPLALAGAHFYALGDRASSRSSPPSVKPLAGRAAPARANS
jgi:uncharacterized membrane protein YbhN (UPF0104 family)